MVVSDVTNLEEVSHDMNAEYLKKPAYSYKPRCVAG